MGNGTFTKKDYHTTKGYFCGGYDSSPGDVAYRALLVPLKGFDGPFFYVRKLGSKQYEITGELYEYQKNWKESMEGRREEIDDTIKYLKSNGRLGYFFLDENGQVIDKQWSKFHYESDQTNIEEEDAI